MIIALEEAEAFVEDQRYEARSRAALVALAAAQSKKKISDVIGEDPAKKRKAKRDKEKSKTDKDALRQAALNKGLNPNF